MSAVRRAARPIGRPIRRFAIGRRTKAWPRYSRLFVAGDGNEWAISDDARQIARLAARLGARVGDERWISAVRGQSIFYASQFSLAESEWERENRLGLAYLHGRPGTPGMPEFDTCYELVRSRHDEIDRIQVPSRAMEELVLGAGVPGEKVFRIPIGIDLDRFRLRRDEERSEARRRLGLPADAFVAGSLQKDGVGWRDGLEPKLIKGPDILLGAVERLRELVPELYVLLTGPARGYVIKGLERAGVAYRHVLLDGPRRRSTRLRGARRVPRHLARRGGAEGGARVDGVGRAARDDAGRPGGGSRP